MPGLAIEGGTPVRATPFPPRIVIGAEEIDAVHALLEKERATGGGLDRYGGEHVDAYEREFAAYHGVGYATAVSSGTAAVHSALSALRIDIAQEVISSPITDPGGVAPILWNNCIPVFAYADPETMNIDPRSVEASPTGRAPSLSPTWPGSRPTWTPSWPSRGPTAWPSSRTAARRTVPSTRGAWWAPWATWRRSA